jgi:nitrogen fixation NifU-like protein
MDYFQSPRNVGDIADVRGVVKNVTCGDIMQMSIKVAREVIMDAKCKTFGCGAAITASSIITENIKGKGIEEALKILNETISDIMAQLPEERFSCLALAMNALRLAIEGYRCKKLEPREKGW